MPGIDYAVRVSSAAGGEGLVEIVPLRPLSPRTRYAFIMNNKMRSTMGVAAGPDLVFGAVRDAHLAGLSAVPGQPALTPLFPAITPLLNAATGLLGIPGNTRDRRVEHADAVDQQRARRDRRRPRRRATPCSRRPASRRRSSGCGLPGLASIYAGYLEVPYYGDPANPLTSFWVNASLQPPNGAEPGAGAARCREAHPAARDAAERKHGPDAAAQRAGPS